MSRAKHLLQAAEEVVTILQRYHIDAGFIGAAALAAYHYIRQTNDLDLDVNTSPTTMRKVVKELRRAGKTSELHEPNAEDPLAGVLDVTGPFGKLHAINFGGRFPAVIRDALAAASLVVRPGSLLKMAPLGELVPLKPDAGGLKSKADVCELLKRNASANLVEIHVLCKGYVLGRLDEILEVRKEEISTHHGGSS
ncbi:MAG: hypothetical protein N2255_01975 [Kiritimatiellae bacterium]|nr:hypothetical protein [Kiritimatiellia bacterium]